MQSRALSLWTTYLRKNWWIYLLGFFFVMMTNMMQVLSTRSLGWVIDFFTSSTFPSFFPLSSTNQNFIFLFGLLVGSYLLMFLGRIGWRLTLGRQTHRADILMRKAVWEHARFFKLKDLQKKFSKGTLMNASNSDVGSARFIFGFTLVGVSDVIFLGLLTSATMLTIHPLMTLYSLSALIALPFIVKKLSALEMVRYEESQDKLSHFDDLTSQAIGTIRLQRLTQTQDLWKRRLDLIAEEYRQKRLKAVFTSLRYIPVMGSAAIITYLILFVFGIRYVINGSMSAGDFVSMQGLIFLIQDPLLELGYIISEWKKASTSLKRLHKIYSYPKESFLLDHISFNHSPAPTVIKAENVSFHYEKQRPLLSNLNLSITQGERIGIHGPIGSGKSTLLRILNGLERNIQGDIRYHGKPFSDYSHQSLRKQMAMVLQRPFLFADTVRQNVLMEKDFSDEEVWYYLDLAGLSDDIKQFPDKLDTPLGEWGINLSGGQKQRLTLARALAQKPQILFLDDCLSAVDTMTEEKILKNLDKELKETTLVWVAHRTSTLKYCHRLIELKNE